MNPTDHQIIETMEQRGGHFVRCLAKTWLAADVANRATIKATWIHTWTAYRLMCIEEMKQDHQINEACDAYFEANRKTEGADICHGKGVAA